jgi:hypothetical protein
MIVRNCAGGIVFFEDKVLLICNDKREWSFPKGVLKAGDKTKLFVTGGNKLTHPSTSGNINGFRAYFQLLDANARSFVLDLDDETTGLEMMSDGRGKMSDVWYDMQGQKLQGKPTAKGVYIVNGKKVVIK